MGDVHHFKFYVESLTNSCPRSVCSSRSPPSHGRHCSSEWSAPGYLIPFRQFHLISGMLDVPEPLPADEGGVVFAISRNYTFGGRRIFVTVIFVLISFYFVFSYKKFFTLVLLQSTSMSY